MKEKMIERINREIEMSKKHFDKFGWDDEHVNNLCKIKGMMIMLSMIDDHEYYFDDCGVHERN